MDAPGEVSAARPWEFATTVKNRMEKRADERCIQGEVGTMANMRTETAGG